MTTQSSSTARGSGRSVPVMVLVGTRKGAFIYRSDAARKKWRVEGPHFLGNIVNHLVLDPRDGRTLHGRVDEPKGDPGNTLTRSELEQKASRLAEFTGAATPEEMSRIFTQIWNLIRITRIESFLSLETPNAVAQPPFLSVRSR